MNPSATHIPEALVLAAGDFGHQVAAALGERQDVLVTDIDAGTHPSLWPYARTIVLASDHERDAVVEALDSAAFLRAVPWVAVHLRPSELQVGPVVRPGSGPCYRCFAQRREQHGAAPVSVQPPPARGFARHHVAMAAALTRQALDDLRSVPPSAHQTLVRRFNLVTGVVAASEVVGVDACQRCRGRFGPREQSRDALWQRLKRATEGMVAPETVMELAT